MSLDLHIESISSAAKDGRVACYKFTLLKAPE